MLSAIMNWSLQNRLLVLLATVGLVILGGYALIHIPIDAFPDVTPVQVQINTVAPALSAEEVERQLTFPVELSISGLKRLKNMRSVSKFGVSQVVLTFEDDIDIYFARQMVLERLTTVETPAEYPRPRMGPVATGLGEVFHYVVTARQGDPTRARTVQDWIIKPALRMVPGTAEVNAWGGYEKQFQVRIDPWRLTKHGLTFTEVADAVRANNLNVGGGYIEHSGEMLLVHGVGRTTSVADIEGIIIATKDGVPIYAKDVANVEVGSEIRRGAVTVNGQGEVVLGLGFLLMGENSADVAQGLRDKFDEVKKTLPEDVRAHAVYNRTELVNHVIDTVRENLFGGALLVIAVLFIFLGNMRTGLIVALAIPLAALFAVIGMWHFGIAASLLSLGALDFGLVVDSSVIMVENIVRRLAQGEADHRPHLDVVREAALEVRKPTMFGELINMIVYLPILTLVGVEGKMFRPMAVTVIFGLVGSLVLSLTFMPVLCSLVLPRRIDEREPLLVRLAQRLYAPVLLTALRHRLAVLGLGAATLAVGVLVARGLGSEFIPRLSEGALVITVYRIPGTSLEESVRYNTEMEKLILAKFPGEVENVWSRVGAAEVATDLMGVEFSDIFITLKPRALWKRTHTHEELVEVMEKELKSLPGQRIAFSQPIEMRINEMVAGVRADVAVKFYGDDFDVLLRKGREIEAVLRSIDGVADLYTEQLAGQPVLRIKVKQEELARYGVNVREVLDLVESVGTKPLGQIYQGQYRFPLAVRLPDEFRASPAAIGAILLQTAKGERIPLSRLASIEVIEGPATVTREGMQRRITVGCNVRGRDIGSFIAEAQRKVADQVSIPAGRHHIEWGGQFDNLERARMRLLIVAPLALGLIFVLLYLTFGSIRDAVLIFSSVPLAAIGGVLALALCGMPFSISAGVGFISLASVSVLNALVLVSCIRDLREQGTPLAQAIEQAGLTRLRPVLMTTFVYILGFLPMALSTGMGAEVQRPLATVFIGGVISSTLLTLVILPVLYLTFGAGAVSASCLDNVAPQSEIAIP